MRKRIGRMLISLGFVLSGAGGILVRYLNHVGSPAVQYLQFANETVQQINFNAGCMLLLIGSIVYLSPDKGQGSERGTAPSG
jgi:hypothetical protein